jgi:tetratricopeptide (TPR) repeat protein
MTISKKPEPVTADPDQVAAFLARGLDHCRKGEWDKGLAYLAALTQYEGSVDLPAAFYSYLGYGIALCQRRYREGINLCEHAVKKEFYKAEGFYNLARVRLLVNDRKRALEALNQGLKIEPRHRGLLRLRKTLGLRRPPVVPFLSRSNILNRLLGRLRHDLKTPAPPAGEPEKGE